MTNLVIVESPTKARTLSRFLGNDFRIEATMGHVRDLPQKRLGLTITEKENGYNFQPLYQTIPSRRKRITELKEIAGKSNSIILATDPDREGEAIAWHVVNILKSPSSIQRIVFHEITQSAIKEALLHPRAIDMPLVDAQQGRRILDRLVGYKLSPLLWNKLGMRWLSAGRVQTVTVRLIVEREREIKAFIPSEYWTIDAEVEKLPVGSGVSFLARLQKENDKKIELKNKEETEKILAGLKDANYHVSHIEKKEVRRYPSPPFTTSSLQQVASNRFGWSAKRTMKIAQDLYEEGYITYHRTDSVNLAQTAVNMAREYIQNIYGKEYMPDIPRFYKTKSKVAQEAHEAVRPTNVKLISASDFGKIKDDVKGKYSLKTFAASVGRDQQMLYSLIWRRFLACQMNEAVFDETTVDILTQKGNSYLLQAKGETVKFIGWLTLYEKLAQFANNNQGNDDGKKELPQLLENEKLHLLTLLPQQKFTQPPARYTEASLIKALEEQGIGRPSTYAPIISTIQDRKYVEKIEKKFQPTDLGFTVVDFLVKYFPDIFAVTFTALMEDNLDEIANGKFTWQKVVSDFYVPFNNKLSQVFKGAERVRIDLGTTDEKCPQCSKPLAVRMSKYGKFLACSGYPTCKFTKNIIEKIDIPCPKCGGDIVLKRTKRGKQFYGCGNYPKCTFAAWKKEDIKS